MTSYTYEDHKKGLVSPFIPSVAKEHGHRDIGKWSWYTGVAQTYPDI